MSKRNAVTTAKSELCLGYGQKINGQQRRSAHFDRVILRRIRAVHCLALEISTFQALSRVEADITPPRHRFVDVLPVSAGTTCYQSPSRQTVPSSATTAMMDVVLLTLGCSICAHRFPSASITPGDPVG